MTLKFVVLMLLAVISAVTSENAKWSNERGKYIFSSSVHNLEFSLIQMKDEAFFQFRCNFHLQ